MSFGDSVRPADGIGSAEWIASARDGAPGTVGGLVPNRYESLLRVYPPAECEDWWTPYRDLFATVAKVGQRHTATPDQAWFAIWEGHGFDNVTTQIAHRGPLDDDAKRTLELRRAALRAENHRRTADILAGLAQVPRFELPNRAYYLVEGPVTAVTQLRYPDMDRWRNPDLFWPDDRRWFVATDVDFWSLYIGGDHDLITELAAGVPTAAEPVSFDYPLEIEN